jgi:hypothetical protein
MSLVDAQCKYRRFHVKQNLKRCTRLQYTVSIVRKRVLSVWSGLSWLWAQISGRQLRTWQRTIVFRELHKITWKGLSSFREGTCSTERVPEEWSIGTHISGGTRFGYPSRHETSPYLSSATTAAAPRNIKHPQLARFKAFFAVYFWPPSFYNVTPRHWLLGSDVSKPLALKT